MYSANLAASLEADVELHILLFLLLQSLLSVDQSAPTTIRLRICSLLIQKKSALRGYGKLRSNSNLEKAKKFTRFAEKIV